MVLRRIKESDRYKALKAFYEKYERFLVPGMLIVGVLVDFLTFKSISIRSAFILLIVHTFIAGAVILFINIADERKWPSRSVALRYLRLAAPLLLQFSFGALLSASLIFYWFSGTLSVSWPILLLVAILMASNEVFRKYYLQPIVQISVYFFILFSLSTLVLPFIVNEIGVGVFIIAGFISLLLIYLYSELFMRLMPKLRKEAQHIAVSVITIYGVIGTMYFLNVIPPIPLSIREAGVYHDLTHAGGSYVLAAEDDSWVEKILPGQTLHVLPSDQLVLFTSIFAPTELSTTIVHEWQYFDESQGRWISQASPSFGISGGRDDGYRGYSVKTIPYEGLWRVDVETQRGQVLGRVRFRVEFVDQEPEFIEVIR